MNSIRRLLLPGLLAMAAAAQAQERERNWWPFYVERVDAAGKTIAQSGAGPLIFSRPATTAASDTAVPSAAATTTSGLRPFWVQTVDGRGDFRTATFLYPLFSYKADEELQSWSLFKLINRTERRPGAPAPESLLGTPETFDVWPFWFSRTTGEPERQYRALFPIAGTVRGRLGFERLSWTLFPLYVENERKGAVTTSTPWPFVRVTRGSATGFTLWPLYGSVERPGVSRDRFWLWPFAYESIRYPSPDDPPGTRPTKRVGVLPFFARAEGPGYVGEDFGWPFFGHTERNRPVNYSEIRWFWPLLVQGRGEGHYVNRWAPFYTHSVVKGYDKTWLAWPLVRHARWQDEAIAHERTQLLWFLYWSHEQRSVANPRAAPAALTHYWPLVSTWDNGAGRRQFQFLSPLSVFFPQLDHVHDSWSPLFALGRYEQRAPGDARLSLLWDGITWEKREAEARREFHLGPLFSVSAQGDQRRVAVGNGLFGLRRAAEGGGWKFFWLDFPAKPTTGSTDRR